ncbi:hypothetical protein DXV75_16250 [Alteromonas aestuariivivens]|uniref:Uncharacterized protein n=1 Tax=Alteromonas aestuariivivens TaxID=1938339 RepID=A0A3D8M328_9ALTE|nr:hypothetical protein [Alteromonas aestuariivivens]RDV24010.1 hypothetical protein DXV75_16250 [Alteromonas aestuariivivens]
MSKSQGRLFSLSSKGQALFQKRHFEIGHRSNGIASNRPASRWCVQWAISLKIGVEDIPQEKIIQAAASVKNPVSQVYEANTFKRIDLFV